MRRKMHLIDKLIAGIVSRIPLLGKTMDAVRSRATFNMPGVSDTSSTMPNPGTTKYNNALNDLYGNNGTAPGMNGPLLNPSDLQTNATGGGFRRGWHLVGERGPELKYENHGGYIAHNGALRGMVAMAQRARDLANGVGMGGGLRGLARAIPNAGSALATAGAIGAGAITYAPTYHMPITIGAGADLDEVRAIMQTTLADHEERVQVDLRRLLND